VIIALALVLLAVFLDGFFAALYWFPWLAPIWKPFVYFAGE
jgi:hypothetical protein